MPEIVTYFSGNYLDRAQATRSNREALVRAWDAPATRFLVIWDERCLIRNSDAARLSRADFGKRGISLDRSVFLGVEKCAALFAVGLEDREEPKDLNGDSFAGLRELVSQVPEREAALLAYARALIHWHRAHRFCGVCGSANESHDGGFMLRRRRAATGVSRGSTRRSSCWLIRRIVACSGGSPHGRSRDSRRLQASWSPVKASRMPCVVKCSRKPTCMSGAANT
jgi:NADH pyrophosphatase-like rudimentary NUDIX domain